MIKLVIMKNKLNLKFKFCFTVYLLLICSSITSAQNVNIVDYLKRVETGEADQVRKELPALLKQNKGNPSILFLDAVLTEAGEQALEKYKNIYRKYPNSHFADASLYRIFSYYFALGYYSKAEKYLSKLKNEFPSSAYVNVADRSIPEEEIEAELTDNTKKEIIAAQPSEQSENKVEYKFTVQAGAFLNYKNAERLKRNFQKSGYFASVYPKEVGGSILNVVIAGKFKTESAAKSFLPELKAKYKLNGRVVPFKGQ